LRRVEQFLLSDHYRMEDEDQELITHLDSCADCRAYMESHAADVETWDHVKQFLKPSEFDNASTALYSAANTLGQASQRPVAIQDVLDELAPTDDPHRLGRIGTYEVTGVVGVGGMGVVLKAIDPSLDRVVAIKVMAPRLANNETARKRFAREAKAAAAVLHPNVIQIHSVSSGGSVPYLVMAYIRGGSLQKRLEKEGPLPLIEVLRIGAQIAAGLAAAHDQGLVHRDIKPENILLDEGVERVTITDFGLARAVDDNTVTQQGTIAGTPMYMSPEQARGDQLDQQSDLFSLGSVLYALCTGRPPYRADSSYGVMRRIIDESPTPIRELNPQIPEWFAAIVERLMAKDKADRFQSAGELHKLLEACLGHVQQPSGIPLPDIPGANRQPLPPTVQGVHRMIKFAAGMVTMAIIAIVVLQYGGLLKPAPNASDGAPAEIRQTAEFDVPEINVDLAERLIGRAEHVTFTKVTTLSPEVAVILGKHPANLSLPAIKQMTPEVAQALVAKKKGLWIGLAGLEEISPEIARELAKAECALDLGGLSHVTPEIAEILAKGHRPMSLGLRSMTPEVAEKLAVHGGWLSLNSLREFDPESAARLAQHKHWLSLNGLSALTPEVAKALGQFDGEKLDLNGLESLDLETAKPLSQAHCQAGLYLNGLKTVTPEVIHELANGNSGLSFQGLTTIDSNAQQALVAARTKLKAVRKHLMLPGSPSKATANTESDLDAIQGTWQFTYLEEGGDPVPAELVEQLQHVFDGESLTMIVGEKEKLATYKLDPTSSPKSIDIIREGNTEQGIYELQGDTLRLCLANDSQPRPTRFDSKPASGRHAIAILKRIVAKQVRGPGESYSVDQVEIQKTVLNDKGQLEITFKTMVETIYACPGANGKMTDQGLELTFVRMQINKKAKVDFPVSPVDAGFGGIITVDAKNKPVFIRSGDKLVKIWEPAD
jgi:uncharacterized protein (TIGR03067 family)